MKETLTLDEFKTYMRKLAAKDSNVKSVQVSGSSIEECLEQAAIELNTAVSQLEYEVIIKGIKGIFGVGKKNYTLVVYKTEEIEETVANINEFGTDEFVEEDVQKDKDGDAVVHLYRGDVFLKVYSPEGKGKKAVLDQVLQKISDRKVTDFDKALVAKVVKLADGMSVKIGSYSPKSSNNTAISLRVEENDMKAYITLTAPGEGGGDLEKDTVLSFLKNNQVVFGVNEKNLEEFLDNPYYGTPFLAAEGSQPVHGADAQIIYNFNTEGLLKVREKKDGSVDFKDKNIIQNVVEGQVLAEKRPAERGVKGRTVTGKTLDAKDGQDKSFSVCPNVKITDKGLKAVSSINGQVLLINDKITVESVYLIDGDVNLSTGNIHFLGTVVVKGNVEDGFSVKASGNIEIMGNVGKCTIDAVGNVVVHQGINCNEAGTVKAGKGVMAKFIQNSAVEAGEIVFVTDGIINSYVDSNGKIICKGKRATVVGGRLRATEEISAKTFGSLAVGSTEIEVGFDPKSKERLLELEESKIAAEKELEEIDRNLVTLENLKKKMRNKFPEEKQKMLDELTEKSEAAKTEIQNIENENASIFEHIKSIKSTGKISAGATVYPGVKITIKDARLDVKNELKRVTFVNEDSMIKTRKYEEPEEESL
ncbi:MAG: FapA family protein [Spirochaetes bacterium]|nr:FapA family protein [Spirochaetota bacterium]